MATSDEETKVKLMAVGDAEIGKTCLLMSFSAGSTKDAPTIFEGLRFNKTITLQNLGQFKLNMNVCDTSSEAIHASLRLKCYKNCDIVLLCFNVMHLQSLQNIDKLWLPEVNKYAPNAVLLLVGLQCDLRRDDNDNAISPLQISEYQAKFQIPHYIECSVLRKLNTAKVFEIGIEQFIISENQHRESRGMSAIASSVEDAGDPSSLNTIIKTHKRQWTEHLFSLGVDDGSDSMLRARDNTNLSFPASNVDTLSNVTASHLPQQSYSQQFAMYPPSQQTGASSYYQQYYPQQGGYNMQPLPNLAEDQSTDPNEAPPPPPPAPAPASLAVFKAASGGTGKAKNGAFKEPLIQKHTASHVGSIDIDYQLQTDDEDDPDKKPKCCSCVVL